MLREGRQIDPTLLGRRSRQRTLLLVDDEENIVAALRRLLRAEGWKVISATSAEQALDRWRDTRSTWCCPTSACRA